MALHTVVQVAFDAAPFPLHVRDQAATSGRDVVGVSQGLAQLALHIHAGAVGLDDHGQAVRDVVQQPMARLRSGRVASFQVWSGLRVAPRL